MSVPVQEAAQALVPLLSAGVDVASRELAGETGSSFAKAALQVIAKLRSSASKPKPDVKEIEGALRTGLADGSVTEAQVRTLVTENISAGKNVYMHNIFNIERDFHG